MIGDRATSHNARPDQTLSVRSPASLSLPRSDFRYPESSFCAGCAAGWRAGGQVGRLADWLANVAYDRYELVSMQITDSPSLSQIEFVFLYFCISDKIENLLVVPFVPDSARVAVKDFYFGPKSQFNPGHVRDASMLAPRRADERLGAPKIPSNNRYTILAGLINVNFTTRSRNIAPVKPHKHQQLTAINPPERKRLTRARELAGALRCLVSGTGAAKV